MAKNGMPRQTFTAIRHPMAKTPSPSHRMRLEINPAFISDQLKR
jgi:hypothetical protein